MVAIDILALRHDDTMDSSAGRTVTTIYWLGLDKILGVYIKSPVCTKSCIYR